MVLGQLVLGKRMISIRISDNSINKDGKYRRIPNYKCVNEYDLKNGM